MTTPNTSVSSVDTLAAHFRTINARLASLERASSGGSGSGGGGVITGVSDGGRVTPVKMMTTPPTVAARATASAITSGQSFDVTTPSPTPGFNTSFFRLTVGGALLQHGPTFPNYLYAEPTDATGNIGNGAGSTYYRIEFIVDCTTFEWKHKGTSGTWRMWVDGELANTPVTVPNDGNLYWQPITFASKGIRHIAIEAYGLKFGGVVIGPTDSIWPPTESRPKVLMMGDSYVEGTGSSFVDGLVPTLSAHLGWDVWAAAQGGSGYVAPGGYTGRYSTRIGFYAGLPFDVVILSGGYNDLTSGNSGSVYTNAMSLINTVRTQWPKAIILVTSPLINRGVQAWDTYLMTGYLALQKAARDQGVRFIDVLSMPFDTEASPSSGTLSASTGVGATTFTCSYIPTLRSTVEVGTGLSNVERRVVTNVAGGGAPFTVTVAALSNAHTSGEIVKTVGPCLWTGTGRVGATTGAGNCDLYVSSDGVHPSPAGHAAIARALAERIRLALVT